MPASMNTVMWPIDLAPVVFDCGRFTHPSLNFRENHRTHTFMVHLFSYPGRVRSDSQEFVVDAGHVVVTPPNTDLAYHFPKPGVHWCLRLIPGFPDPIGRSLHLPLQTDLGDDRFEAQRRLNAIALDLEKAAKNNDHPCTLAASAGALSFLGWLAGQAAQQIHQAGRRLRLDRAVEQAATILSHGENRNVSIAEIARRCQASQNRLMAAFRKRYGESMIAFRNRLAIRNAQWRFDTTQATIAEIRQAVGIEDPHHFNKLFHKIVGVSPSAYRQRFKPVLSSITFQKQDIGRSRKTPGQSRSTSARRR